MAEPEQPSSRALLWPPWERLISVLAGRGPAVANPDPPASDLARFISGTDQIRLGRQIHLTPNGLVKA
jgi:hypothetical protein